MKKLTREDMRNIQGGFAKQEGGCAACGAACSINNAPESRICCAGGTCMDQGEEKGSICN